MDKYKKAVEYYANNRLNSIIFNDSTDHANIIFNQFFDMAVDRICIHAHNLNNELGNSEIYQKQLERFLDRDGELTLILEEYIEDSSIVKFLKQKKHNKNKVCKINTYITSKKFFSTNSEGDKKQIHFCFVDNSIYRIEYNVEMRSAICNFNDSAVVQKLSAFVEHAKSEFEVYKL